MTDRLFALVRETDSPKQVKHYSGLPPELARDRDQRVEMPWPRALLVIKQPDGYFLYRYTADGIFAGDTWHESLHRALDQAAFEYGEALGEWRDIPEGITDEVEYALTRSAMETSEKGLDD